MNRYVIDWDRYAALARQTAAEGAVLLRNEDGALPLKAGERIAVFGRIQFHYYKSGTGSGGMVNTRYVTGILDALKREDGISLDAGLEETYRRWEEDHPFDMGKGWAQEPWSQEEMPLDDEVVLRAADSSDAALVVIGRTAGEDKDAANEKGSYLLTDLEEEMLAKVCRAFSRVIVLLNVGNIIDMRWVETYHPQAVLYVWQGGMEGGNAVADVLMGRVNPCGKLSDTIAERIEDYPSTEHFGGEHGDRYVEDIYVGYRYFETFAREKVLYPFGYGLSYTSFQVACTAAERAGDRMILKMQVTNTGSCAGKEVVQAYVNPPQGKLGKPVRNLVAFAKTSHLKPGESEQLVLEITDYSMSSYDEKGVTGEQTRSCYVLEAGTYEIYAGTDVRSAIQVAGFEEEETRVVARCQEALAPVEPYQRMRPERAAADEEGNDVFRIAWEDVPQRTYSMKERSANEPLCEIPYEGDRGYKLGDVYDGHISLDVFLSQLKDEDLCCLVRGEGMCSPKVTPGTAAAFGGVTDSLQGLGIPAVCCTDGPSGIRMDCGYYAFSMPNGTCLACTFNEEITEELYRMEGVELRKNRIDMLLGPGINIHRNPLNGRNFEYFSEDPFLTGKMAVAQLKGMHSFGVTGTVKHFAANNQEYHRRQCNAVVSERALREIYLKGFEYAVREGEAYSIMSTYGAVNGLWTASNFDLLTTVLRKEWGYQGLVMTDWWADMNDEGGPASVTNTAAMIRAQNDLYMVTASAEENAMQDNLAAGLADGSLKRAAMQRSAKNILSIILRTPALEWSLGRISEEEQEAHRQMSAAEQKESVEAFTGEFCPMDSLLELDVSSEDKSRGRSLAYGIRTMTAGSYHLRMNVKVDASNLAQISVNFFVDGQILGTHTKRGTDGKWEEILQPLGVLTEGNHILKLFFAESGMQIEKIVIEMVEE